MIRLRQENCSSNTKRRLLFLGLARLLEHQPCSAKHREITRACLQGRTMQSHQRHYHNFREFPCLNFLIQVTGQSL